MEIELLEIRDFLAGYHPFDQLPEKALSDLPGRLQVRYYRRGADIPDSGALKNSLYVIRTGAVELKGVDNELLARLGEGDIFGYRVSTGGYQQAIQAKAIEDCLLYQLPARDVDALCETHPPFAFFFSSADGRTTKESILSLQGQSGSDLNLMTTQLGSMIAREPVTVTPETSIRDTAGLMTEHKVSSILVAEQGALKGIVTDRDFRKRVVAKGLDFSLPITAIMTPDPLTMDVGDLAFEAMLKMVRHNIHHLPITQAGQARGMLTATDFTQRQATSAVYLVGDIYKQSKVEKLKEITAKVPQLLLNLASAEAPADTIGHMITAVTDAVTVRLLQLAEEKLGAPPVPYAWIAAGSQARSEQTAKSDQDNCLVIDDAFDQSQHGEYFAALSRFVCDGLNECGYVYCPGEMMAMTDKWRQPLGMWKSYFDKWTEQPEPMALMLTCVFFDLRCVYGEVNLFRDLRQYFLTKTRGNRIFLAHMAGNALSHRPPLGFFRNFVLISGGDHDHTFDLKHNGIIPIVDLARVYALAAGSDAVNTMDRLAVVAEGGEVSSTGAQDLGDSLEFISQLRIEHQGKQIRSGQAPDNFMSPDDLSQFERNQLKDAFSVVRTMQSVLEQRYRR